MNRLFFILILLYSFFNTQYITGQSQKATPDSIQLSFVNSDKGGNIPKYSRFELGVRLPASVQQSVNAFLTNSSGSQLNPYDPDHIKLSCSYTSLTTKIIYKRNGFYFQDFSVIKNVWTPLATDYPFRLRFAPPDVGKYTAIVQLDIKDSLICVKSLTFEVVETNNPGHLRINNTLVKLEFDNGAPFFGIGENIPWADMDIANPNFPAFQNYWENMSSPYTHDIHRRYLDNLADNGGNFVRIRLDAWSVPIESMDKKERPFLPSPHYPEQLTKYITNYHHNQMFMWEMDRTLEKCEARKLYILLTLFPDCDFGLNDTTQVKGGVTLGGWYKNPYSGLLHDNTIKGIHKFFISDTAKIAAKKKVTIYGGALGI